ncbi:SMP-30/gluconolactonase/LRE family protein [Paracoccus sanguinis]|uniref:SMP-30/gluconolactonase/LRE family protein n=1 Tax=Paracoccus sanguinis TaxID=1545044 RepID=UPI00051FAA78|nr:SMP-30/gluconolactonase/LRE family protein [Paracoccus sanguinis]KGJ14541.1 gluconolactonase [Paracoccus sanguinis]
MQIFDDTRCELGEGALWHPERQSFFWFDILGRRLYERGPAGRTEWEMPELTSAMGWVGGGLVVLSSESGLWLFDLDRGLREPLVAIAADAAGLRSNDGRADPWGGFWHSTMGKAAEPGAGGIWRWHRGTLRHLYRNITIPNAICFDEARRLAYFADTAAQVVWVQPLDAAGWPAGPHRVFLDLGAEGLNPDGAVTDAEGRVWIALWGAGRIDAFDPEGRRVGSVPVPARQVTCPAFGGPDLGALMATSAWEGLDAPARAADPQAGCCFVVQATARGLPAPRVRVDKG